MLDFDNINLVFLPTGGDGTADVVDQISTDKRSSLYLDLTECTLDCSIELCESSMTSSIAQTNSPSLNFKRQNSFEKDESLGILTPDQMKEYLDSNAGTSYLELSGNLLGNSPAMKKIGGVDQTPSPEELPLDPVFIKVTDSSQTAPLEVNTKADTLVKSTDLKLSNSFITSITSIGSLDNGYQGDGEMSRPASRGGNNSPYSIRPKVTKNKTLAVNPEKNMHANNLAAIPIVRRQDQMTDSDFFTESDADDIFHRGDRRVQIIDGHLYNRQGQAADVFIDDQEHIEDSNMDSSGIFTDVENRVDDHPVDIECDTSAGSTDTIKSFATNCPKATSTGSDKTRENKQDKDLTCKSPSPKFEKCKSPNQETKADNTINSNKPKNSIKPKRDPPKVAATAKTFTNLKLRRTSPSHKQNKNEVNVALRKHEKSKRESPVHGEHKKPKSSPPRSEKIIADINEKSKTKTETEKKSVFVAPAQKTAISKAPVLKKIGASISANLKASSMSDIKRKSKDSSRLSTTSSTGTSSPDVKKMSLTKFSSE